MKLKTLAAALAVGLGVTSAFAQDSGPVKIGFITDMSGLYADIDGPAGADDRGAGGSNTMRQPDAA